MRSLLILLFMALFGANAGAQLVGDTDYGLASYYSNEYDGSTTSYGVKYDRNDLVAAHKLYPFNSRVRVRNTDNGKEVDVRIIDKGPFIRGRIIELSERAASQIGLLSATSNTAPVEVTLLSTPDQPARKRSEEREEIVTTPPPAPVQAERRPALPPETTVAEAENEPEPQPAPRRSAVTPPPPATAPTAPATARTQDPARATSVRPVTSTVRAQVKTSGKQSSRSLAKQTQFSPGIYKVEIRDKPVGLYGVQVGNFSTLGHAMDKIVQLQNQYFDNILLEKVPVGPNFTYKIILGPFVDLPSAQNYSADLKTRYKIPGFTVELPQLP